MLPPAADGCGPPPTGAAVEGISADHEADLDELVGPALLVLNSESDYVHAAMAWVPGAPFPVIACDSLERHRRRARGRLARVRVGGTTCQDSLVVSCGTTSSEAVGHLLAAATRRQHVHVSREDVPRVLATSSGSVALVGVLEDVATMGDWPGMWHPQLGVVTARTLATLSTLVYRTVSAPPTADAGVMRLVHPTIPGSEDADITSIDEIGLARDSTSEILTVRGHGRECCIHLPDGILCGRPSAPDTPLTLLPQGDVRLPSCLLQEGCFRTDVEEEDRQPAQDLGARVVLIEACDAVAVGVNALPHEVNVALALLEGAAVAVVGPVGLHEVTAGAEKLVIDGLSKGAAIGRVVDGLNVTAARTTGDMCRFGLLGDPAITCPGLGSEQTSGRVRHRPGLPDDIRAAVQGELLALNSLEMLQWLGLPVLSKDLAAVRDSRVAPLMASTRTERRVDERRWTDALTEMRLARQEVEKQALLGLTEAVHNSFWQFTGETMPEFTQETSDPVSCPSCHGPSAVRVGYRHRLDRRLLVELCSCRRCGPLTWEAGAAPSGFGPRLPSDLRATLDERTRARGELVNPGSDPAHAVLGTAFVDGRRHGYEPPRLTVISIPAGSTPLDLEFRVPAGVRPDLGQLVVLCLSAGRLSSATTYLDVRAGGGR